jgi:hypothetical protein
MIITNIHLTGEDFKLVSYPGATGRRGLSIRCNDGGGVCDIFFDRPALAKLLDELEQNHKALVDQEDGPSDDDTEGLAVQAANAAQAARTEAP